MAPKEKQQIEIEKTHRDPLPSFNQAVTVDCSDFLGTALIPHNYLLEFCRTSGKRSGLLPVRFGQRAHAPAFGRSVSSWGSNGAFVRSRWISRSIHARSSRTVVTSAFLSFRMAAAFRYCGKHSCRARRWSFAWSRAISNA